MARILAAVGVLSLPLEAAKHSAAQQRRYKVLDCKGTFEILNADVMDECTPYVIPAPAAIMVNQTNETHYASYHFQGATDCSGKGSLLSYWEVGKCVNESWGGSQLRVWVDAPKPPLSVCAVPGVCGRGYQGCCIGSDITGHKCNCHLHNGTGEAASRDCGSCGNKFVECCSAFKITGNACGCDVGDNAAVVV